ncbi:fez family zinc finger protein 2-like [Haliotis rufescens]|uniref:fez family zinc finger protein 2-like n=1 Tax=Haliotis rufescens TaxID=6454 RepID=UPI001EB02A42|nr:fez family zinc finger protein 2-like [Haliotis rufescens]
MDGPLFMHVPCRPTPVYCQRPLVLDAVGCRYPLPVGGDCTRVPPLKLAREADGQGKTASTPLATLPYSLSLFDHMRRQHATCYRVLDNIKSSLAPSLTQPGVLVPERTLALPTSELFNIRAQAALPEKVPPSEGLQGMVGSVSDPYSSQYGYGRKIFPCPQCRYTTDRRNNLKRHMLTMHQACSKLLECCGILFTTKASLREHAMIFHYHGYTCFYCGRRFCRKALLKRHLSVHNGQKDFVCTICDYATSHKSNLERHRKVHARQEDGGCEGETSSDDPKNQSGDENIVDVSSDELSICSDEDEEINVHSV